MASGEQPRVAGVDQRDRRPDGHAHRHGADHVGGLAADPVGQRTEEPVQEHRDEAGDEDTQQRVGAVQLDDRGGVGDEVGNADVGEDALAEVDAGDQQDLPPVLLERDLDREFDLFLVLVDRDELRALTDGEADEQADDDQGGAEQERDPPAPGQELLVRELRHGQERHGGQRGPGGGAHLRERPVQAAFADRCVLDGHQRGAAPLTADAEALQDAEHASAGSAPGCRWWRTRAAGPCRTSRRPCPSGR